MGGTAASHGSGALAAAGTASVLGLGDDFVGQSASLLFARQEGCWYGTPKQGQFQGNHFNHKININGDEEAEYDLLRRSCGEDEPLDN